MVPNSRSRARPIAVTTVVTMSRIDGGRPGDHEEAALERGVVVEARHEADAGDGAPRRFDAAEIEDEAAARGVPLDGGRRVDGLGGLGAVHQRLDLGGAARAELVAELARHDHRDLRVAELERAHRGLVRGERP